jgi:DNA polymerase-1
VKDVVDALNIPRYELSGFEADDLIGTVSKRVSAGNGVLDGVVAPHGVRTIVVTGDKDLLQLVDDKIHVWLPGRGKGNLDEELDAPAVKKMVSCPQVIDLKALMGDSSIIFPASRRSQKPPSCSSTNIRLLDGVYQAVDRLSTATPAQLSQKDCPQAFGKLSPTKKMAYSP